MGNVAATLAGSVIPQQIAFFADPQAFSAKNVLAGKFSPIKLTGEVAGIIGGYYGNASVADKSPEEIKELVHNRAVAMLARNGIAGEEINQAFDRYFDPSPIKVNGWRNFGNVLTTELGATLAMWGGAALNNAVGLPQHGFSIKNGKAAFNIVPGLINGALGMVGGYVGNKIWQGPSQKAIEERSLDIVTKILAERRPVGVEMSQMEALQHRDGQHSQSTEVVR